MNKIARKSAPLGFMIVITMWCCWTQLSDPKPLIASTDDEKLPRIERDTLHPELSAVAQRDAFLRFEPEPVEQPEVVETIESLVPEEPPVDPQAILRGLRLDATVMGATRLSVINGRVFNEGEKIVLDSSPNVHIQVMKIRTNGIQLKIEEETFDVGHGHAAPRAQQGPSAPASAGRKLPSLADLSKMINSPPEAGQRRSPAPEELEGELSELEVGSSPQPVPVSPDPR